MSQAENNNGYDQTPVIGKVASPTSKEATADQFYFWVDREALVENTQIVRTQSQIGGQTYTFFAVVEQVFRVSRLASMGEAMDQTDGVAGEEPILNSAGVTYALARVLRTEPPVYTPPLDQSMVYLCNKEEAGKSYGSDENAQPLVVGQIKNGGAATAGAGMIDLDYLLGGNGGHMNVNGVAGRGTKSSFLLFSIYMLLREAQQQKVADQNNPDRLRVVPIIFNVKGFDLFTINQPNKNFKPAKHLAGWQALGVYDPQPFTGVRYLAAQRPGGSTAIPTPGQAVKPYSWSLSDIVERGLLLYLFAEEDAEDANFSYLVMDIEAWLTEDTQHADGSTTRKLRSSMAAQAVDDHSDGNGSGAAAYGPHFVPQTFGELLDWVKTLSRNKLPAEWSAHYPATWRKLARRLGKLLAESKGILRRSDHHGNPLKVTALDTTDPLVIDLNGLTGSPSMQRFVVATVLNQLKEERTGQNAVKGLVYLVTLDELNRFAPRGGRDPITTLIELVAAEMRSQGIILLGAQQQASKISERVFENAGIKVVGRSGSLEMGQQIWKFLSEPTRKKATNLLAEEKLIVQDTFREPMLVAVPFPVWAMRPAEVDSAAAESAKSTDYEAEMNG